jgi:uncharacterized membrane protein
LTTTQQPVTGRTRDLVILIDKAIFQLAKHWLACINLATGLYAGLPLLAPLLMIAGWTAPAKAIYFLYRVACHQRPERSYFFGGPQIIYTPDQLAVAGVDLNPLARDIGNQAVGWKVAFCERDVAIYGIIFLAGLLFAVLRRWRGRWLMPLRYYILFIVPMAVDGTLQLLGLYESNWISRSITGAIFGLGSVLFTYPYLEDAFADVRRTLNSKLHLEPSSLPDRGGTDTS